MNRKKLFVISVVVALGIAGAVTCFSVLMRPMDEETALRLLESPNEAERRLAIERLGRLRSARAVAPLVSMLSAESADPSHLGPAGTALARIGPPAVPHLVEVSRVPDTYVGLTAAAVLAEIGPAALPGLFAALDTRDESIRLFAKIAFSRMGPPVVPTVEALDHPDPFVRAAVIHLLATQEDRFAGAVSKIIEALGDQEPVVRAAAAEALGVIDAAGGEVASALLSARYDESGGVRAAVAEALGYAPSAAVAPAMTDALADGDLRVRLAAVKAMAALSRKGGARPALPALVSRLGDRDPRVRKAAAAVVAELGLSTRAVVSLLEEVLAREARDEVVAAATRALNRIQEGRDSRRLR